MTGRELLELLNRHAGKLELEVELTGQTLILHPSAGWIDRKWKARPTFVEHVGAKLVIVTEETE